MGKITYVTCAYCGRQVPRDHAVPLYKGVNLGQAVGEESPIFVGYGGVKVYVCISCAKHRGISFRDWRERVVREDRKERVKKRKKALGRKRTTR